MESTVRKLNFSRLGNITWSIFGSSILKRYERSYSTVFPLNFFSIKFQWLTSQSGLHSELLWHYQIARTCYFWFFSNMYQWILKGDLVNLGKKKTKSTYWDTGSFQSWWCWQSLWFWLVPVSSIVHCFCGRLKDKNNSYFLSKSPVVTKHFQNYCSNTVAKQGKRASLSLLNLQQHKFSISSVLENKPDFEASDGFKDM